ncbi:MAG TPA: Mu transposase C-terminal domain-containing protein [Ktedonobacteraceae bacterium]|jgi:putative transposase
MKAFAFEHWCAHLQLSTATRDFLLRVRSSPPARRVQGRLLNVCGTYASHKMGVSIQFESHLVELWAIYTMEYDRAVLEYFDQPCHLELRYRGPSGRPTKAQHTPDFLILRTDGAAFEEWKPEEKLLELMVTHPGRYIRDDNGTWRCPPGEAAAESYGLSYRVRSSAELHPTYIRNLIFLEDYFFDCAVSNVALMQILEAVETTPGITLAALREQHEHLRVDDVYALIARNRLYVDLSATWLKEQHHLALYLDRPTAEAHTLLRTHRGGPPFEHLTSTNLATLHANAPLDWDGKRWTLLNLGKTTTTLLPEEGALIHLETPGFLHLIDTQAIRVRDTSPGAELALSTEVHRLLTEAGPEALDVANQRYLVVEAYQNKQREMYAGTPTRTIRDWLAHFRDAEAAYGCGYVGLLPKTAARGNRTPKADAASRRLLDEAIAHWYARPKQQKAREVFVTYQRTCLDHHVQPVTERTFYRQLKKASSPALTEKRRGARAAYQESLWYWELERTTPRHGDRPWEIAHIDHTQLDIELLSRLGKPLGRPWATFLVDAYSRRLLAVYLTFDPPSYRSVMMVLRVCVRRLGRLPQMLVVDGGKEFRSRYFETLLNSYACHKKYRPWAKPRYGSVIERLFGSANTTFVFNLLGNTQASKTARQMTSAVNPKNQAVWQLPDLYDFLCEWAYEVYDQQTHPALSLSPREAWEHGLDLGGPREHRRIRYDDLFRILTLPGSPRETALVYRNHGIQFHYLLYWNDVFAAPGVNGTKVRLRFDPFDISHIYAFVHNHWVECITPSYYGQLHGHSEREVALASADVREQNRKSHVRTPIDAGRLADFLAKIEAHEAVLLQRQRDIENQVVIYRMEHQQTPGAEQPQPASHAPVQQHDESSELFSRFASVDLTALQVYEEYG